jgi:hypothetical protein
MGGVVLAGALVLLWVLVKMDDELKRTGKPGGCCLIVGIAFVGILVAAISSGAVSYWTVFAYVGPVVGGLAVPVLLMVLVHKVLPKEKPTSPVPVLAQQPPSAPQPAITSGEGHPKPGEKERVVREFVRRLSMDEEAVGLARAYPTDKMVAFVLRDKLLDLACPENLIEEAIRSFLKPDKG